jgi:hypothetical protein
MRGVSQSARLSEHEMTRKIVLSPNPVEAVLFRELNHRINNELACAICTVSAQAVVSDNVAIKTALFDVVDLLHQWPMFIGRCGCRTMDASPTWRVTSSSFAFP